MTNIQAMAEQLKEETAWQRTPEEQLPSQYIKMILKGIETQFIDSGRASTFDGLEKGEEEYAPYIDYDFTVTEKHYVMVCAQIDFFKRVQSDVNNIVSYTTDALSVTNADKPYAHLQDTLAGLENERRRLHYKMTDYCM